MSHGYRICPETLTNKVARKMGLRTPKTVSFDIIDQPVSSREINQIQPGPQLTKITTATAGLNIGKERAESVGIGRMARMSCCPAGSSVPKNSCDDPDITRPTKLRKARVIDEMVLSPSGRRRLSKRDRFSAPTTISRSETRHSSTVTAQLNPSARREDTEEPQYSRGKMQDWMDIDDLAEWQHVKAENQRLEKDAFGSTPVMSRLGLEGRRRE